jgi:hypothetical protein
MHQLVFFKIKSLVFSVDLNQVHAEENKILFDETMQKADEKKPLSISRRKHSIDYNKSTK